jgi:uncharacterized membrane protein
MLKTNINFSKFALIFSLFIFAAVAAIPMTAEAITIKATNRFSQQMSLALILYDSGAKKWYTVGWYTVTPNSTRTLNFNGSLNNVVYIHAYNSEAKWGGGEGSVTRTVIKKPFKYYSGAAAPSGEGRRTERFSKKYAENNGTVYWKP